ncbi:MAG: efflux RND transporter periplasmic adaptor subunit [Planctomycetota bacterium]|jgi:multidrug efflux pump subunit AcrA (membrane-fusion protein)
MRNTLILLAIVLAGACSKGSGGSENGGEYGKNGDKDGDQPEFLVPVRLEKPGRGEVEDWVETQANLESDRHAMILAEVEGRIVEKHADLGHRIGKPENGETDFLLARIDDRDLKLALREATIKVKEQKGRLKELVVDLARAGRQLDQTKLEAEEAAAILKRTTNGIKDGTITYEEHESAVFKEKVARAKVAAIEADEEKTRLQLELGAVAIEDAEAKEERARVALEKSQLRAPFAGVVSFCTVNVGERVRVGDHLFTVEDPSSLVVYGEIPVRQANRIRRGNVVRIGSSAVPHATAGRVELIAPTVDSEAGTIRVKASVDSKEGFRPGLFVTMRIVVETHSEALVVKKRSVMHDDETGPYVYIVRDGKAYQTSIKTGFQRDDAIEVVEGVGADDLVVVEGQDVLTDEAMVEVQDS